jgi:ankyrin repeat protein
MSIGESEILDQKESLLIISAEPGMGKSTLLEKLVRDSNSDIFLIKIILNNFTKVLKEIKDNKIKLEEKNNLDFIFENLMARKLSEFEILILKNLSQQNKLYLMFDGIDEVSDYKEQVKFLIKSIRDSCQLKKVFLTTRNNLREELENFFELVSFNLNNFGVNDQKSFLTKYWQSLNKNLDMSILTRLAEELILKLESSLMKNICQLIGIPIQTKMIADIFYGKLNSVEEFATLKLNNIADLYHEFIETKFNIQFEQKYKYEIARDQDDYEVRKRQFYVDHIKCSNRILFGNVDPQCLNELDEKRLVKFGIIVFFKNKSPIFLHQSYAEYFVALDAFFKIKQNNDYYKEFKQILRKNENFLVRQFLDNFMYKDQNSKVNVALRGEKSNKILSRLISSIKSRIFKRDFKTELENCCKENLFYLLKYLLEKKKAKIKKNEQLLIIASDNGHKDIVELLLDKGIDINQKSEYWKRNALHVASEKGHSEIVELLIDRGIDINLQDIDGSNALHLAFLNDKRDIVELLIERGIDIRQQNNFGRNALHCASKSCYTEIVKLLLDKGLDINIKDYDKRNALQWASVRGRKSTVELLIEKGIDLNEIDKHGDNALNLAIKNGHKEIAILLIEKGVNFGEKNKTGKSAFDLASELGHEEIVQLLVENGVILF